MAGFGLTAGALLGLAQSHDGDGMGAAINKRPERPIGMSAPALSIEIGDQDGSNKA
ncbi:MAG: hypothetical protein H6813_01740 [Phycisphaeraceae bacterium]|nr:hypothetical protein [Phycisphaeraceae bacterium]